MPADEKFASCAHCNNLTFDWPQCDFERYKVTFSSKEITRSSIIEGLLDTLKFRVSTLFFDAFGKVIIVKNKKIN